VYARIITALHWHLSVMRTPVALPPSSQERSSDMLRRRRFKQTQSLQERLIQEAKRLYDEARLLPPGPVRDAALKRARQAEAAAHLDEWLNSPGLRPPKDNNPAHG
jgi:hypothetical protein